MLLTRAAFICSIPAMNSRSDAVVGLDIGTTSTVAVVMRPDGETIAAASRPARLFSPEPGFAEADPAEWWDNACATLTEAVAAASVVPAAICVTGMLPAVVLLDDAGRPLRRSLQQNDARCVQEIEEMRGVLLWLLGIPIPIIILLYLFHVI